MSRIIFYAILFYLLYKFVTEFLIPVGKASQQVRKNVQRMQEEQQQFAQRQQQFAHQQQEEVSRQQKEKEAEKDYIDFEEVK